MIWLNNLGWAAAIIRNPEISANITENVYMMATPSAEVQVTARLTETDDVVISTQ